MLVTAKVLTISWCPTVSPFSSLPLLCLVMPKVIALVIVTVYHLCIIHQSATTLNPLTGEVNNTDHPTNVQSGCHLSPPLHLLHLCRPSTHPPPSHGTGDPWWYNLPTLQEKCLLLHYKTQLWMSINGKCLYLVHLALLCQDIDTGPLGDVPVVSSIRVMAAVWVLVRWVWMNLNLENLEAWSTP